jgi:hypothetical protein
LDKKVFRAIKKLENEANPQAPRAVEDYNYKRVLMLDQVDLALFSVDFVTEPTTYEEAINCEKKEEQIKWKHSIIKEFKELAKRGLWEIIDEKNISINFRSIKIKWVFKVKTWDFPCKTCGIWLHSSPRN